MLVNKKIIEYCQNQRGKSFGFLFGLNFLILLDENYRNFVFTFLRDYLNTPMIHLNISIKDL